MKKRSGIIAIVGQPNVGKSTLLNCLVGQKLAGVSNRPQTTRATVKGILTRLEGQILFQDTPGHHQPRNALGHWMLREIESAVQGVDLVYWLVTPEPVDLISSKILKIIQTLQAPVFLVVNQIDRFPKPQILPIIEAYQKEYAFKEIIPISALKKEQIELLIQKTYECLPEGDLGYEEDQLSVQQERFFIQEIVREKVFRLTRQEIPYATSVQVQQVKTNEKGIVCIEAFIYLQKNSQKAIVIGARGQLLKKIGQAARKDIEHFLGARVYLQLWVKVLAEWNDDPSLLKRLGYDS